jgi:TRAP-type uncharacterized transport system fused permease subunit
MRGSLIDGARQAIAVGIACAIVGVIIGVLTLTGAASNFAEFVLEVGSKSLLLSLLLTMAVCLVLGMGIPTIPNYIITSAIAAPALLKLGVPLIVSHMFVFYFGIMADLTPPVALAAFAAANIGGADPNRTGWTAARIGWSAYIVPFLFVFSPSLLMHGEPLVVAWAAITAALGIWLGTIGVVGFFYRPLGPALRALYAAAGVLTLIPADMFRGAYLTDVVGLAMGALLLARELGLRKARA